MTATSLKRPRADNPRFLLKPNVEGRVSEELSQLNISYACTSALIKGLNLLDPGKPLSERLTSIASGTHRLLPYSLKFWVDHCLDYAKWGGILEKYRPLPRHLAELQQRHDQLVQETIDRDSSHHRSANVAEGKNFEDRLKFLQHLPIYQLMYDVLSVQWKTSQHPCETGEGWSAIIPKQKTDV